MKKVLVIIDGLGDLPCKQFQGETPLEYAETSNLDYLTAHGKLGYMYPVNETYAPESHTAMISILGNEFLNSSRGVFEALGAGLKLKRGDLALRANFATIDNDNYQYYLYIYYNQFSAISASLQFAGCRIKYTIGGEAPTSTSAISKEK